MERCTLVVPLDGSVLAEKALPIAIALARATPVQLILVRATFDVDPAALSGSESVLLASARERVELREARRALDELRSRLAQAGIVARTVATRGAPADVILDVAARQRAHLILLTTHGHQGLDRVMYGSVAAEVLRRTTVPLLVVPPAVSETWSANQPHRVLVLVDGSPLSERVLEPAGLLGTVLHAGVLLLRVLEPPPVSTFAHMPQLAVDLRDRHRDQGQQYLAGLRERLPADLRSFDARAVISGQVTGTIRDVAQREGCDVIALASHGRGGVSRLLLGSTAAELVRDATTPMLIVGPACHPN